MAIKLNSIEILELVGCFRSMLSEMTSANRLVLLCIAIVCSTFDTTASDLGKYELVGVFKIGEDLRFNLRDGSDGISFWLCSNQEFDGLTVASWDQSTQALVLQRNGSSRTLLLKAANVKTLSSWANRDPVLIEARTRRLEASESGSMEAMVGYMMRKERTEERRRLARENAVSEASSRTR